MFYKVSPTIVYLNGLRSTSGFSRERGVPQKPLIKPFAAEGIVFFFFFFGNECTVSLRALTGPLRIDPATIFQRAERRQWQRRRQHTAFTWRHQERGGSHGSQYVPGWR